MRSGHYDRVDMQTVLKIGFYLQHIPLVKYGLVFQHACSKH